ncbi:MAG TPA: bifunctional glutamate N-acetyltransferase/amino-acid acetyltransferase ArgJ [Candidatus Dormibacteraeota bacterium]|jgi:glutamate N-acetyltransferase/amino-acid N-acetyltransferase|nr:bifunctional glutamate N-acetyltransferase/amino-acid acetyltransferase ArgJ [Candidatus Dormibacteraeota bacterium]
MTVQPIHPAEPMHPAAATATRQGVCAPRGFQAGAAAADIRLHDDDERLDVAVLRSDVPCQVAGVFTRNIVKAAPVVISQLSLRRPGVQAVVLNSGNANACTGAQGFKDALQMCKATGDATDLDPSQVLVCSTGVIGRPMPMDRVVNGIRKAAAALSQDGDARAARAIMTTDTVAKEASTVFEAGGRRYTVGGMAKGAGMIHPDMATMIAVVTTDAPVANGTLQPLLARVADETFNCVTVDGDTSTNDTLLLLANGQAGGEPFAEGSAELAALEAAVLDVADSLAEQLVADAEGATKYFRVAVQQAETRDAARLAARTVAGSPLVKTAIHGGDPNWGRIVAALGRSGAHFALDRLRVAIGGTPVFENGSPVVANTDSIRQAFAQRRVEIDVQLGAGDFEGHAWGCDLSAEYVHINADYTT